LVRFFQLLSCWGSRGDKPPKAKSVRAFSHPDLQLDLSLLTGLLTLFMTFFRLPLSRLDLILLKAFNDAEGYQH
jgi:hypothetical protein